MVEHQGMFNNLITKVPALGLTERDVIAQTASQCFDISVWQNLTALTCGARVEVFPDEISRDPARLLEQLAARGVTILETVPSMIRALLEIADAGMELPTLRWLLPSGEAFPPELCRQWMQRFPDLKLLNAYGPAECSDDVSYHPIDLPGEGDLTVPIGRPVDNTRLYLLNRWLEPVPIGVPGEICVGGTKSGVGISTVRISPQRRSSPISLVKWGRGYTARGIWGGIERMAYWSFWGALTIKSKSADTVSSPER